MIVRDEMVDILVTWTDINVSQKDLWTPKHHKWLVAIQDNISSKKRSFSYQCVGQPKVDDILYVLVNEYNTTTSLRDFDDFCRNFGYSNKRYGYESVREFKKVQSMYNKMLMNVERMNFLFSKKQLQHLNKRYKNY